nr:hypothetical protein [Tanacetum cinerariifolium]
PSNVDEPVPNGLLQVVFCGPFFMVGYQLRMVVFWVRIVVVVVILDSSEVVVVIGKTVAVHFFGILHCVPYGGKHGCDEEIEFCKDGVDGFEKKDWSNRVEADVTTPRHIRV